MKYFFEFFLKKYTDIDYELKSKMKILLSIILFCSLLLLVVSIITLSGNKNIGLILLSFLLFFILCFLLIYKTKYDLAVLIFLFIIIIVSFLNNIIFSKEKIIANFLFMGIFSLFLSTILSYKKINIIISGILIILFFLFSEYLLHFSKSFNFDYKTISDIVAALMTLIITIIFGVMGFNIVKKAIFLMNEEVEKNSEKAEIIKHILISSQESMNIGKSLNSSTGITLESINTIKIEMEKVKGMVENFRKNLDITLTENNNVVNETEKSILIISDQNAAIHETSAIVTQMVSSINNISETTQNKKIDLKNLISNTDEGKKNVDIVMDSMKNLEKNTSNIFEMTVVINNIAEQTNLLAMNAAIEAAHAGEYGKGFNVVAEEIRKLSEKTAEQIKYIKDIIDSNISGVKSVVENNEAVEKQFKVIIDEIYIFTSSIEEIIANLKEMAIGSKEINIAVSQLTDLSIKSLDSVNIMKSSIDKSLNNIKNLDIFFNNLMNTITEFIGIFSIIEENTNIIKQIGDNNIKQIEILNEKISKI